MCQISEVPPLGFLHFTQNKVIAASGHLYVKERCFAHLADQVGAGGAGMFGQEQQQGSQ